MSSSSYLVPLKLSQYVDVFDDWGAEMPDEIQDMDIEELMAEFDMKKGHAKRLRKWLDERLSEGASSTGADIAPKKISIFLSGRFPSQPGAAVHEPGAVAQMTYVRHALVRRGYEVTPNESAHDDRRQEEIFDAIDRCELFVFFGTQTYGKNTGNPMCTHFEFTQAQGEGKRMAWIKMCDRIDASVVRSGCRGAGLIFKPWEETSAMIDWIVEKIGAGGGGGGGGAGGGAAAAAADVPSGGAASRRPETGIKSS